MFFCCMFKIFNTGTSKNAKDIKEGNKKTFWKTRKNQLTMY